MALLLAVVATYVTFVIETSLVPQLGWGALAPQLELAALVWVVRRSTDGAGLAIAVAWGLIADGLSHGTLGIGLITHVAAAGVIQSLRGRSPGSPLTIGAITGVVAFFVPVVDASIHLAIEQQPVDIERLCLAVLGPAVSTTIFATAVSIVWQLLRGRAKSASNPPAANVPNQWRMLTE